MDTYHPKTVLIGPSDSAYFLQPLRQPEVAKNMLSTYQKQQINPFSLPTQAVPCTHGIDRRPTTCISWPFGIRNPQKKIWWPEKHQRGTVNAKNPAAHPRTWPQFHTGLTPLHWPSNRPSADVAPVTATSACRFEHFWLDTMHWASNVHTAQNLRCFGQELSQKCHFELQRKKTSLFVTLQKLM